MSTSNHTKKLIAQFSWRSEQNDNDEICRQPDVWSVKYKEHHGTFSPTILLNSHSEV